MLPNKYKCHIIHYKVKVYDCVLAYYILIENKNVVEEILSVWGPLRTFSGWFLKHGCVSRFRDSDRNSDLMR